MQEEVEQRVVTLVVDCAKLTEQELVKALKLMLQKLKEQKQSKQPHGKMTVKQLAEQNKGMQSIEVTDKNIGSFTKIARKYGIDFALKKDRSTSPPRHLVFFKGRDADVLKAAFDEFSKKKLTKEKLPSVRKVLLAFKEQAKAINKGREVVKNKDRGIER